MKNTASIKTVFVLIALLCLLSSGDVTTPLTLGAQEANSQETTEQQTPPKTRQKPRGRVPNHYGWLGVFLFSFR